MGGKNIGDLLNAAGITWGSFMGGFDLNIVNPDGIDRLHSQTSTGLAGDDEATTFRTTRSFSTTGLRPPTTPTRVRLRRRRSDGTAPANHQYDIARFLRPLHRPAIFPPVSFLKAPAISGWPRRLFRSAGRADVRRQDPQLSCSSSRTWSSTAVVVIAYDDSDGWYDHQMSPIVNQSTSPADALTGRGSLRDGATSSLPGFNPDEPARAGTLRLRAAPAVAGGLTLGAAELCRPHRDRSDFDDPLHRRQLAGRTAHWRRIVRCHRQLDQPDVRLHQNPEQRDSPPERRYRREAVDESFFDGCRQAIPSLACISLYREFSDNMTLQRVTFDCD